ncbi:MAG: GNAT family N-acetyltransferase [Chloroflexi bacterium]|nr:MAG: GNAT family N-acetyltransferase [Chloroflexota bacterium]
MNFPDLLPPLEPAILALTQKLPRKPAPVVLSGHFVRLEPLDFARDAAALFRVSNGDAITLGGRTIGPYDAEKLVWRYLFAGPFDSLADFISYCEQQRDAPDGLCLSVFDTATGAPIGMTNFMSNAPGHLKIELGGIWYSPIAQGTKANTEATYLMLDHAFGLGYRRVEWKCNALNVRSRRAALRMGFQFEGIQESHMIVKGRSRDTAWFRILAHEWPAVERHLRQQLYE